MNMQNAGSRSFCRAFSGVYAREGAKHDKLSFLHVKKDRMRQGTQFVNANSFVLK
jgi:hypothetical protein